MEEMTCPACQQTMHPQRVADAEVARCGGCSGVFLPRAEMGALLDAEEDLQAGRGASQTAPLPRITADMAGPPASRAEPRSLVRALFG